MLFIEYPKCSTCQKAKKWLDAHGVAYEDRDIKQNNPTAAELAAWQAESGLPVKRFFNTSGMLYRSLGLKDKLPAMTADEQFALLGTDGMLVKRPIIVDGGTVLVGFKPHEWAAHFGVEDEPNGVSDDRRRAFPPAAPSAKTPREPRTRR